MPHAPIPSPKLQFTKTTRHRAWYQFYAMFSEDFARRIICDARLASGSVVLDPWLGAGTTTSVAARLGLRSVGVDVNPAMVAISLGRSLDRESANRAVRLINGYVDHNGGVPSTVNDPLYDWFKPSAAREFRRWEQAIRVAVPEAGAERERALLLTALFETAREIASGCTSKNPTWTKRPAPDKRASAPAKRIRDLFLHAAARRVSLCTNDCPRYQPMIQLSTATKLPVRDGAADLILTSPPYCTRIDYAVSTGIELAVLGAPTDEFKSLRDISMGTTTIRDEVAEVRDQWGRTCVRFLGAVARHPSKASASYYLKTFLQYFDDLFRSLSEVCRCARRGATVVIVVQDSYYKGIHIDVPRVVAQMADSLGWNLAKRRRFRITRNMRRINTRSRAYRESVDASEVVLWFVTAR
jgi:tRNA G10  N-methylase Trm11